MRKHKRNEASSNRKNLITMEYGPAEGIEESVGGWIITHREFALY